MSTEERDFSKLGLSPSKEMFMACFFGYKMDDEYALDIIQSNEDHLAYVHFLEMLPKSINLEQLVQDEEDKLEKKYLKLSTIWGDIRDKLRPFVEIREKGEFSLSVISKDGKLFIHVVGKDVDVDTDIEVPSQIGTSVMKMQQREALIREDIEYAEERISRLHNAEVQLEKEGVF